jgi:hypothetical protein
MYWDRESMVQVLLSFCIFSEQAILQNKVFWMTLVLPLLAALGGWLDREDVVHMNTFPYLPIGTADNCTGPTKQKAL